MPRLRASQRYALREVREAWVRAALKSGRLTYQQRGHRIKCTICGRVGYTDGYWVDNCLKGHVHVCACGNAFSTKQALGTHRRHHPHH